MKIFDCFLFFNELELLELRLMTLNKVVDYFVLVEADRTFTGNKKEFLFEKNKNKYKDYLDKIIHVKVENAPILDKSKNVWAIEHFQRNCITRGLSEVKDEDKIIISDVDEIPDPEIVLQVKDTDKPIAFGQYLFYYYVNCFSGRTWNGSIITPFKNMSIPQTLRNLARKGISKIKYSGWHYSYMGGVDRIRSKLDNLVDADTVVDRIGTDEDIANKVNTQKGLWEKKHQYFLIDIMKKNYAPKCIKKFLKKYPDFYFQET